MMAVRMTSITVVDRKGRITVPKSIRDVVGLVEGMYVLLSADAENRRMTVIPFADPTAKLVQVKVRIGDVPGSLARIAKVLADADVDLLASESRTLRRRRLAEWFAIADVSACRLSLEEIREGVLRKGGAKTVEIREY